MPTSTPAAPAATPPGLDDRERSLDPRIVTVWRVFGALWMVPMYGVATVLGFTLLGRWGWLVAAAGLLLVAVLLGWYPPVRFRRWRWRLTELAMALERGVLVHHRTSVPYFRIQQIDVLQGPVDRLLGLATLQVTTAAATGTVSLPGIPHDDAPGVRAELLARAARAVAEHPGDLSDAV